MNNGTALRPEPPTPGYTELTHAEYVDLQRRAEDGDLIRRAERAWKCINGSDLRHELHVLAATYEEMRRMMATQAVRQPAAVPDRPPSAGPPAP